jgi:pimeloyl-ACP methyl ester carboxylesterase
MPTRPLLLALVLALVLAPSATAAEIRSEPVSFPVENVNRSALPCPSDGRAVTLRGRIVRPAAGRPRTAVLFLHEFSFGRFFWDFSAVPGYDLAARLARAGHAAVVVDRLGYDASDRPPGLDTCLGAHADMARQVVGALRRDFGTVVLAGHSVGGAIAELAAHSFDDLGIAGIVSFAWADQGFSDRTVQQSFDQGSRCLTGGEPSEDGGPGGYAFYGQTEQEFRDNVFASAEPAVVAAATALRNRDPCGDAGSLTQAGIVNGRRLERIEVPVLLLFGDRDATFQPGTGERQAAAFSGSPDVTLRTFAGAGHALTLERQAPAVGSALEGWLAGRWPASAQASPPAPAPTGLPCRSRRVLDIRVPAGTRATVSVTGRRTRVVRRPSRRVRVSLRGLPAGRVTVSIRVRRRGGDTARIVRRYRTCARRRG